MMDDGNSNKCIGNKSQCDKQILIWNSYAKIKHSDWLLQIT